MFFGNFPFGDLHDAPMRGGSKKEVDNKKFYEILGLSRDATEEDIKRAYRKLAIKHHPDKGGDQETFKELSRAYEVLSNPEKRQTYDEYGEEGLDGSATTDPGDIFDLFFGGGGSRKRSQGKRRGEDIESPIKVTLEQIYNGTVRKMAINRDVICEACDGHGGPKESIADCALCKGTGVRVQIRQIGPMIQQTQSPCTACRQGKIMPESKKCKRCMGVGTCKERKVLECYIEKGVPDGHKINFPGEADEKPGTVTGDVRFITACQDHPVFKRRGSNLYMKKEVTLYEALTGYRFVIDQLDGRKLLVKGNPNEVVKPGEVRIIRNEGLPVFKNITETGHLIIEFTIRMPAAEELLVRGIALENHLRKVLPSPAPLIIKDHDHFEEVVVGIPTQEDFEPKTARGQSRSAYEEDDDEGGRGGHRVQCNQQ